MVPSLLGLAWLYEQLQKPDKAEPLLLRALEIEEKAMGPNHPNVLARLNGLARFFRIQGRDTEADFFTKRAREIAGKAEKEKPGGPHHPDSFASLTNSAGLYMTQGN